jgi:hypothetical protein
MRASSLRRRFPLLAATLSVAAVVALGGAIGGVAEAKTNHHSHKPAAKILELGGTWSGNYHGSRFSGSFTLNWTQSGTKLSGSLKLSDPSGTYSCTGTISGGSIQFGAVSVGAVYTGSVSSNAKSMSGNWKSPADSGSWSATKS